MTSIADIVPLTPVKVAVRLRPFRKSEKEEGSKSIITINNEKRQCQITNPTNGEIKAFTFDYVYDSFVDPNHTNHASQETIWNDIGSDLLDACMSGYNFTCFATGQTGSGKSHSMLGFGEADENKGILPRACDSIFEKINNYKIEARNKESDGIGEGNDDEDTHFKVKVSMLEIYNEKIRDLFVPLSRQDRAGLKIRDSPKTGAYVDGLKKISVESVEQIRRLMDFGTRNRTIAATNMNETSSRAHTIFTVTFIRTTVNKTTLKASDKTSLINLVDLAGSERVGKTGAEGDRLTEGGHINKSLSALGNVINTLASNVTKKKPGVVPYRSSLLTHLLKPSLGGNAKTTILAAISPADMNYGETLSTLRFADRAKQIKNVAIVNEDPNDRLIRQLKEEMQMLRKQLQSASGLGSREKEAIKAEMEDMFKKKMSLEKAEWEKTQEDMEGSMQTSTQYPPETPFLTNLNQDFLLSGVLKLYLYGESEKIIGSSKKVQQDKNGDQNNNDPQQIIIGGMGVKEVHAKIKIIRKEATEGSLSSIFISAYEKARTMVNGRLLSPNDDFIELKHNDRIIFGNNCPYKVVIPNKEDQTNIIIDWEMAMKEANASIIEKVEKENKIKKEMAEREKAAMEKKVKLLEEQLEKKHKKLLEEGATKDQMVMKQKDLEERLRHQILETEKFKKEKEREQKERSIIDRQLLHILPLVHEANSISIEMGKCLKFHAKLISKALNENMTLEFDHNQSEFSTEVCVAVSKDEENNKGETDKSRRHKSNRRRSSIHICNNVSEPSQYQQIWSLAKFNSRIYVMREMYQTWLYYDKSLQGTEFENMEEDPFHDQPQDHLIGVARIHLEALSYVLDIEECTPIVDYTGKSWGELSATIVPFVVQENSLYCNDEFEELYEALGKQLQISVVIKSARGIPTQFVEVYKSIFVRWRFLHGDWLKSDLVPLDDENSPIFQEESLSFTITKELCTFVRQGAVVIEVWSSAVASQSSNQSSAKQNTDRDDKELREDQSSHDSDRSKHFFDLSKENRMLRDKVKELSRKLAEARKEIDTLKK